MNTKLTINLVFMNLICISIMFLISVVIHSEKYMEYVNNDNQNKTINTIINSIMYDKYFKKVKVGNLRGLIDIRREEVENNFANYCVESVKNTIVNYFDKRNTTITVPVCIYYEYNDEDEYKISNVMKKCINELKILFLNKQIIDMYNITLNSTIKNISSKIKNDCIIYKIKLD